MMEPAPPQSSRDALVLGALMAALAAFVALTWAQWPTLTADGARELYVPFRIAHGHVIYRDFTYMYGPVAPWISGLLLGVFGAHLNVLYTAAAVQTGLIMALLYVAARHVLAPLRAGAVVVIFFTHFALGRDLEGYLWPYAFAATYAVLWGLGLVVALMRHAFTQKRGWLALAGALAGLSAVTKLEYGLAAVALLTPYVVARGLLRARLAATVPGWQEVLVAYVPLGAVAGGIVAAVLSTTPLATVLDCVWPTKLMAAWSSGGQWHGSAATWKENLRFLLVALLPLTLVAAHRRLLAGERRAWEFVAGTAVAIAVFALTKPDRLPFIWDFGHRFWVGPSFVVLLLALALAVPRLFRTPAIPPVLVAWCLIGGYGLLVAARTVFRGMNEYTGYQAPIALIAWVALATVWLPTFVDRTRPRATGWLLTALLLGLSGRHVVDAVSRYAPTDVAVTGAAGTVLAEPAYGEPFNAALAWLRPRLGPTDTIVALPMEASLYLFLGRDNPVKEDNLFFGYLTTPAEQADFIARLKGKHVRYVVRSNFGYPGKRFGSDYMQDLAAWLQTRCHAVAHFGGDPYGLTIFETPFGGGKRAANAFDTPPSRMIVR